MKIELAEKGTSGVYLWLHGDELDPADVTKRIGIAASKQCKKGDRHVTSTGSEIIRKRGMWSLDSSNNSDPIANQISEILGLFKENQNLFQLFPRLQTAELSIFCAVDHDSEGEGMVELSIENEVLVAAAALGLEISVSLHVVRP